MSFFPLYMNMNGMKVLLVGGGTIAGEKLEKLLDFTDDITLIACEVNVQVEQLVKEHRLRLDQRCYQKGDIDGFNIVIVATDTEALYQEIYAESRGKGVLVNSVDNIKYCDFIFPSYVQKGELTIAFSTGGASPAFAKQLRHYFEKRIPDSVASFLQKMQALRTTIPKGKARMKHFDTLVQRYFSKHFK